MNTTVGLFDTVTDAEEAVRELMDQGLGQENLGFLTPDTNFGKPADTVPTLEGANPGSKQLGSKVGKGSLMGGLGGLVLGELMVPGIGWVAAAGTIATGLVGAGLGAIAGSMTAAMDNLGVPKDQRTRYAQAMEQGRSILTVRCSDDRLNMVNAILSKHHAKDLDAREDGSDTTIFPS